MPLNRRNCRTFHRTLYCSILETVTLLKRNNDQQEGVVTSIRLFQVRRKSVAHSGEPLLGLMASSDYTIWQIPRIELQRVGVADLNALDRIVGSDGIVWQPESTETVDIKLFTDIVNVRARRVQ